MSGVRMPFGKWSGCLLSDIPEDYLLWVLRTVDLSLWLRGKIEEEMDLRGGISDVEVHDATKIPPGFLPLVEGIIRSGYKQKALKLHPDVGGDNQSMRALTDAYNWLLAHFDIGGKR